MDRQPQGHGDLIQPDKVDELMLFIEPSIRDVLDQLEPGEFTTSQFIELYCSTPTGAVVYEEALAMWGERNLRMSRMVIHGQVIPGVLRRQPDVEWAGYAHADPDPYGVSAWWRLGTG
ncbi:MAG TPA: hypothetical protein PK691_11615 [Thermomicrobiales bacterium]|nr:hypothetical protein [Thermomicrobiales bacterium]